MQLSSGALASVSMVAAGAFWIKTSPEFHVQGIHADIHMHHRAGHYEACHVRGRVDEIALLGVGAQV
jgi:hypothetical protein